eukprot:scaffold143135_cov14-Tisochrysis_lutea.AAC.1
MIAMTSDEAAGLHLGMGQGQGSAASLHQRIEEKRKAMHAEEALPTSSNNKETRVDSKKPEIPSSKDF